MSGLQNRPSRSVRERRAYNLVAVGGIAGAVFVVGLLLALFGVIGMGIPVVALIVAAVCGLMFRGMTTRR
jgi:hypothetical protein